MGERRNDWTAIGAYAAVATANQMLWLTFAPITTASAAHYGVSEDAIGWLSEIFPLLYVVLAVPAGLLLDRRLREVLAGAAGLSALGACVRLARNDYAFALAGQVLIAIAQPAILGAITKLASERLEPESRTLGISIGSAGIFAGAVLALGLGAAVGARDGLTPLLAAGAAVSLVAFAAVALALRRPGAHEAEESAAIGLRELRVIWSDAILRRLSLVAFLGFGVFVALTTWLQVLLEPAGIGSSTAAWLLVAMTMSGVVGSLVLPEPVARRGAEQAMLRAASVGVAASLLTLAVTGRLGVATAAIVVAGLLLLSALPVLLELTERRAGVAGASAAGAIWLAGNAGGIVVALLVQSVKSHPSAAFVVLAAFALGIIPWVRGLARIEPLASLAPRAAGAAAAVSAATDGSGAGAAR